MRPLTVFVLGSTLLFPTVARADDLDADRLANDLRVRERQSFVVGNAPGILLGRLSVDFGSFVAPHLAPSASFHVQGTGLPLKNVQDSLVGVGGELGMRLYGAELRPSGPFIGVYGVGGRYHSTSGLFGLDKETSITSYGVATDAGWSFCTKGHVIVALGGGVEYRWSQSEPNQEGNFARLFVMGGVHPRVLMQIGAFL